MRKRTKPHHEERRARKRRSGGVAHYSIQCTVPRSVHLFEADNTSRIDWSNDEEKNAPTFVSSVLGPSSTRQLFVQRRATATPFYSSSLLSCSSQ
jgi:hypothetical protein